VIRILALVALTACGHGVFRLSADENNAYALDETLAKRKLPAQPSPVNSFGSPRVFVVANQVLLAYDLAGGRELCRVGADVRSRIAVGGDFIVAQEGNDLVARDGFRGTRRWKADIAGSLVGVAADRERAYAVTKDGGTYRIAAYDGSSGSQLWSDESSGALGGPEAHGGVVYVPFFSQWLAILDGKTGAQLTRIRGIDEQITMLRVTSTVAYYGSKLGVFRLDHRSATGRRADATYGKVPIPPQLDRTTYGHDTYNPIQTKIGRASCRERV